MINNLHERFWSKVQICEHGYDCEDCCWLWLAGANDHGYGNFYIGWVNGKKIQCRSHVVSWRFYNNMQRVPKQHNILHSCDNPPCCNPHHLFSGTTQENVDDKIRKGRVRFLKGSEVSTSKLTEAKVLKVREQFASGNFTQKQLAGRFGVSASKIKHVLSRVSWSHVLDDYQPKINLIMRQRNHHLKLSDEDVIAIRFSYINNEMQYNYSELGRLFGFSARYISDLCQGKYRVDAGGPISYPK